MKKTFKYILIITSIVIIGLVAFYFIIPSKEEKLTNQGNEIIQKIEKYRVDNGHLPNSLTEIGIKEKEEGPLYYDKRDSINYTLSFGTSLGESETYHSETKKWTSY